MNRSIAERIGIWLGIIALAVFLIDRMLVVVGFFASTLLMFASAWLIALVLEPVVRRITAAPLPIRRAAAGPIHVPRLTAVLMVYTTLLGVLVVSGLSLVPILTMQLATIAAGLPETGNTLAGWIRGLEAELARLGGPVVIGEMIQPEAIAQQIAAFGSSVVQQSLGLIGGLAALLFNIFIVLILSFYMTADGGRIAARIIRILPHAWRDEVEALFAIVDRTFGGFLRAQLLNSLIYAGATVIAMALLGLGNIAFAAVMSAALVFIPLVGGYLALIAPVLIALVEAPDRLPLTIIVLLVIQQVQFNVLTPRLVGQIIGLHPLLVFAALLMGGTLAGGWGILFGIPIAGVIASIAHFIYLRSGSAGGEATPLAARESAEPTRLVPPPDVAVSTGGSPAAVEAPAPSRDA
ncbi:MAG: AI-2E family transporter [Chloroflexi bacterium]|nr:AI-2E family transporter [Chloroflexota bacterium]